MKRLTVEIIFFSTAKGGRETLPNLKSGVYRPHLVVGGREPRMSDSLLGIRFVDGPEHFDADEFILATVEAIYPGVDYAGLQQGAAFSIHEGGGVVGQGRVVGTAA